VLEMVEYGRAKHEAADIILRARRPKITSAHLCTLFLFFYKSLTRVQLERYFYQSSIPSNPWNTDGWRVR
jgi:hypothetical protein